MKFNCPNLMNIDVGIAHPDSEITKTDIVHGGVGEGTDFSALVGRPIPNHFTIVNAIWPSVTRWCIRPTGMMNLAMNIVPHVVIEASFDVEEARMIQVLVPGLMVWKKVSLIGFLLTFLAFLSWMDLLISLEVQKSRRCSGSSLADRSVCSDQGPETLVNSE